MPSSAKLLTFPVALHAVPRPAALAHQALHAVTGAPPGSLPVHLVRNLAVCAVEALDGLRPIEQFASLVSHDVAVSLNLRRQLRHERRVSYRDQRRSVPSPGAVTLSQPARGVIEAAIVVSIGTRSCAVAMRLEWAHERWRATHLTVL